MGYRERHMNEEMNILSTHFAKNSSCCKMMMIVGNVHSLPLNSKNNPQRIHKKMGYCYYQFQHTIGLPLASHMLKASK